MTWLVGNLRAMARRMTSVRAAAVRRAQEVRARRDADRLIRERAVESTLADFYEAVTTAAAIRDDAQRKAARVIADAQAATAIPQDTARAAVRRLRALGEPPAQIATLPGLRPHEIRAILTPTPGATPGGVARPNTDTGTTSPGQPGGERAQPQARPV